MYNIYVHLRSLTNKDKKHKMKYQIIGFIATVFLLLSCASEQKKLTDGGFEYTVFPGGGNQAPAENDYVYFHINMMADDTKQFDSRDQGEESMVQLTSQPNDHLITSAMQQVLGNATVGDLSLIHI